MCRKGTLLTAKKRASNLPRAVDEAPRVEEEHALPGEGKWLARLAGDVGSDHLRNLGAVLAVPGEQEGVVLELALGQRDGGQERREHHGGECLDVVVEAAGALAVHREQLGRGGVPEVLKVDQGAVAESPADSSQELVHQGIVVVAPHTPAGLPASQLAPNQQRCSHRMPHAPLQYIRPLGPSSPVLETDVERRVEEPVVVAPNVDVDRQTGRGADARARRVHLELADRDAHALDPQVAEPQNPLPVSDHDAADAPLGPIFYGLQDTPLVPDREEEPPRHRLEHQAVLEACLAHLRQPGNSVCGAGSERAEAAGIPRAARRTSGQGRTHRGHVHDGHQLLYVVREAPVKEPLVSVGKRGQVAVLFEIVLHPPEIDHDPLHLGLLVQVRGGKKAAKVEPVALALGEGEALVVLWVAHQLGPVDHRADPGGLVALVLLVTAGEAGTLWGRGGQETEPSPLLARAGGHRAEPGATSHEPIPSNRYRTTQSHLDVAAARALGKVAHGGQASRIRALERAHTVYRLHPGGKEPPGHVS